MIHITQESYALFSILSYARRYWRRSLKRTTVTQAAWNKTWNQHDLKTTVTRCKRMTRFGYPRLLPSCKPSCGPINAKPGPPARKMLASARMMRQVSRCGRFPMVKPLLAGAPMMAMSLSQLLLLNDNTSAKGRSKVYPMG